MHLPHACVAPVFQPAAALCPRLGPPRLQRRRPRLAAPPVRGLAADPKRLVQKFFEVPQKILVRAGQRLRLRTLLNLVEDRPPLRVGHAAHAVLVIALPRLGQLRSARPAPPPPASGRGTSTPNPDDG